MGNVKSAVGIADSGVGNGISEGGFTNSGVGFTVSEVGFPDSEGDFGVSGQEIADSGLRNVAYDDPSSRRADSIKSCRCGRGAGVYKREFSVRGESAVGQWRPECERLGQVSRSPNPERTA
jgi:hypothetical protein